MATSTAGVPSAKAATSSASKGAVKKTAGAAAKAVGAEVAGGGPENPVADVIALKEAAGALKSDAPKTSKKPPKASKKGVKVRGVSWAWSGSKNLLLAEFLIVVVITGLGTLTTTGSVKDEMPKLMVKATALSAIFFVAALLAGSGKKTAQVATAITTLITIAYVFTSPESRQLVNFVGAFFAPDREAK